MFIRELGWGEVKVRIENGKPTLIYEAIRTYKLEERSSSDLKPEKKPEKKQKNRFAGATGYNSF